MGEFDETNWRIYFWDLWEEWDDEGVQWLLGLFPQPADFMHWAEKPCEDLDGLTPWQLVMGFGVDRMVAYLGYLTNKPYWDRVCQEYHQKMSSEVSA